MYNPMQTLYRSYPNIFHVTSLWGVTEVVMLVVVSNVSVERIAYVLS